MKIKIRKGVFETNSSSMHSLVVKKESEYITPEEAKDELWLYDDGTIEVWDENKLYFGRHPFRFLYGLKDKALYAIASMCEKYKGAVYQEVCEAIRSVCPDFTDFVLPGRMITRSKEDFTSETIRIYADNNYWDYYSISEDEDFWYIHTVNTGTVDEDILSSFLKKENISIAEFLLNKRYVVVVDGDEYCIFKNMKKHGLINTDNIEREYSPGDIYGDDY